MDSPIFKLDNVVRIREEEALENFVGPLDLILYLLSKNKIELQDIKIADILDQYLAYIDKRHEMDLEVASEFVSMAAHLVYIKTRMLLSVEDAEAQSELEQLIQSLEERKRSETYKNVKIFAEGLSERNSFGQNIFVRSPEHSGMETIYEYDHEKEDLFNCFKVLRSHTQAEELPPFEAFDGIVMHEPYPVEAKAESIIERLIKKGKAVFRSLFQGARSRSEIVATFLAVLELCKGNQVRIAGSASDCTIDYIGGKTDED